MSQIDYIIQFWLWAIFGPHAERTKLFEMQKVTVNQTVMCVRAVAIGARLPSPRALTGYTI